MSTPDLFDPDAAWNRAEAGMDRAAGRAERVAPGWRETALSSLRLYAETHAEVVAEDIGLDVPADADRRAIGALLTEAKRRGWIRSDGTRLDRWGSHKTRWRSLIFTGGLEP